MKKKIKTKKHLLNHDRFMPDIEEIVLAEGPNEKRLVKAINKTIEKRQFVPISSIFYNKISKTFNIIMARYRKIINFLI